MTALVVKLEASAELLDALRAIADALREGRCASGEGNPPRQAQASNEGVVSVGDTAPHLPVWTDERKDALRRMYPAGVAMAEIMDALAALPGSPLPDKGSVRVKATNPVEKGGLGLRRPTPNYNRVDYVKWSDARSMVLDEAWVQGYPIEDIEQRLNSLAGATLSRADIEERARNRGLLRPEIRAAREAAPPVLASFDAIRSWASFRGLALEDMGDLPAINEKRISLGLPKFEVQGRKW